MQIVIDIPDEIYKKYMDDRVRVTDVLHAVRHGTPLPKGHGRIIDESKINKIYKYTEENLSNNLKHIKTIITHTDAPTIIEADKGSEDNACLDEGNTR